MFPVGRKRLCLCDYDTRAAQSKRRLSNGLPSLSALLPLLPSVWVSLYHRERACSEKGSSAMALERTHSLSLDAPNITLRDAGPLKTHKRMQPEALISRGIKDHMLFQFF